MRFELSDTQQAIKDSAREFFSKEARMAEVRRIIDSETAFDAALWRKIADQGYTGMIFSEQYGGVGLGLVEMAAMLEEMGRALVPGPFFGTVLLAGTILNLTQGEAHKRSCLAPICSGEARATLALLERSASWDRDAVQLEAREGRDGGYELRGEKLFVPDATVAGVMIVAARTAGSRELALFVVPSSTLGVRCTPTPSVDLTRRLYHVVFDGVRVPGEQLLAKGKQAEAILDRALDIAAVGLAAEMVGGMQQLLDHTVAYVKTRSQFGRPIGSFQAVQHRCVDLLALLEGSRSATYYAAWALGQHDPGDEGHPGHHSARLAVSVAKASASDAFREAGNIAIQAQGGMGFTWENDTHLYYRRAKGSELACGDATFHRERIGRALTGRSA